MSGETERNISAWTNDTVLLHLSKLIDTNDLRYQQRYDAQQVALGAAFTAQEKSVNAALVAAKEAVVKAEAAAEKRFDSVNEFRGQLADQARTFMPRAEYQVMHDALIERVTKTEQFMMQNMGHSEGSADLWGYIVGAAALFATIAAVVIAFTK